MLVIILRVHFIVYVPDKLRLALMVLLDAEVLLYKAGSDGLNRLLRQEELLGLCIPECLYELINLLLRVVTQFVVLEDLSVK